MTPVTSRMMLSKAKTPETTPVKQAVRQYLPLDGRWTVPWVARPTTPSANRLLRARWTVAWGSSTMSANSVDSTNGIRLRASRNRRSDNAMHRA